MIFLVYLLLNSIFVFWIYYRHQKVESLLKKKETRTNHELMEKKKIEQSLQEALFYRDEFLSIASHELKTPLTSLMLQSQLFRRSIQRKDPDAYSPARVDRLTGEVERQVGRLTRLVDDMLDISRIRTGKLSFTKERINIMELVTDVVERMRPQFVQSGKELPRLFFEDVGESECDKMRIEQVLTNLLSNAFRYGKGLPIDVRARKFGQMIEISISDRGIGISEEDQSRIFSRFQRAVPASEVSGLGLGLYITKQIIEGHGGTIEVESRPEKGSTFRFYLPLLRSSAESLVAL